MIQTYGRIVQQSKKMSDLYNSEYIGDDEVLEYFKFAFSRVYELITGSNIDFYLRHKELKQAPVELGLWANDGEMNFLLEEESDEVGKIRFVKVGNESIKPYPNIERLTAPFTGYRVLFESIKKNPEPETGVEFESVKYLNVINCNRTDVVIEYYLSPETILGDVRDFTKIDLPNEYFFRLIELYLKKDFRSRQEKDVSGVDQEIEQTKIEAVASLENDAFKYTKIANVFRGRRNDF